MRYYIPLIIILCFIALPAIHGETITEKGLRIEVSYKESEFKDILEFTVIAENKTNTEKMLLGTISLDPQKYGDMDEEMRTTPVYMEILPKETVEDIFYLITAYEVTSPQWYFKVDSIYDFIIDEDFSAEDYPEITEDMMEEFAEEIDQEMEETMTTDNFSITGFWKMETTKEAKIYGNWSWMFQDDGTVVIGEILGPEARMPMEYKGSYEIKGTVVKLSINMRSPFPDQLTIQGEKLIGKGIILTKTGDDMSIF